MATPLEQLELAVLRLPPMDRSHLLDRPIDSLDDSKAIDANEAVARLRALIR